MGEAKGLSKRAAGFFLAFEVLMVILYAFFVRHEGPEGEKGPSKSRRSSSAADAEPPFNVGAYAAFQDVHAMIFVGFGFLMTFLSRYNYSSLSFNFLLAAAAVQWSILCQGFFHAFHSGHSHITLKLSNILVADIAAASYLIAFGVVIGRLTPTQYLIMALVQMPLFAANEHLTYVIFGASDAGGSIVVHLFGAVFGLAVSWSLAVRDHKNYDDRDCTLSNNRVSNIFSMLGTIFLWIFWPSFNAAVATPGIDQQRAVINTFLSISASVVTSFALSFLVSHERKLEMEHLQNSTLAGGVAIGAIADKLESPVGAIAIGSAIGIISVLGFKFIRPWHQSRTMLLDTCGVMHLHGIPGLVSGIASIFLYLIQGAGIGNTGPTEAGPKALVQLQAIGATCGVALAGGIFTGLLLNVPLWKRLKRDLWYDDYAYFEGPNSDDSPHVMADRPSQVVIFGASTISNNGSSDTSSRSIKRSLMPSTKLEPINR